MTALCDFVNLLREIWRKPTAEEQAEIDKFERLKELISKEVDRLNAAALRNDVENGNG